MVRLGKTEVSPLTELDEIINRANLKVDDDDDYEPTPKVVPKDEDNTSSDGAEKPFGGIAIEEFIQQVGEKDYLKDAHRARIERELTEKYGPFKDLILHPWSQDLIARFDDAKHVKWVDPSRVMPLQFALMILLMAWSKRVRGMPLMLLTGFLFGVHPAVIILIILVWMNVVGRRRKPKGYVQSPSKTAPSLKNAAPGPKTRKPNVNIRTCYKAEKPPSEADYVVVGSDIGALYCAALLSRCGKKIVVLEEGNIVGGGCVVELGEEAKSLEFVLHDQTVSRGPVYVSMLNSAMERHHGPAPTWYKIGAMATENVHGIMDLGDGSPWLRRSGHLCWLDDMATLGADRNLCSAFLNIAGQMNKDARWWIMNKLNDSNGVPLAQSITGFTFDFAAMLKRTVNEVLSAWRIANPRLFALLMAQASTFEILDPDELSYGAFCTKVLQTVEGMWACAAGPLAVLSALTDTIEASGGSILCQASVRCLNFESAPTTQRNDKVETKPTVPAAKTPAPTTTMNNTVTGVTLADGHVITAKEGVISGLGIHRTWAQLIPSNMAEDARAQVEAIAAARPVIYTLVALKGDAEELQLMDADYFEVSPCVNEDGEELSVNEQNWVHICFPSAKDPSWEAKYPGRSTCVIVTQAPKECHSQGTKEAILLKHKDQLESKLKEKLIEAFPQLEGCIDFMRTMREPVERGLSQAAKNFSEEASELLRPEVQGIKGLSLTGRDLVMNSTEGAIMGGWLTAHHVLGYTATDVTLFSRNIISELLNV